MMTTTVRIGHGVRIAFANLGSIARFKIINCALRSTDNRLVRFAEASSKFDQRVEHCFEIES
jgi:hypothetical protein